MLSMGYVDRSAHTVAVPSPYLIASCATYRPTANTLTPKHLTPIPILYVLSTAKISKCTAYVGGESDTDENDHLPYVC